jgi:hypothetical protein
MIPPRPVSLALALAALRRMGGQDGPSIAEAAASLNHTGRLAVFPLLAVLGMVPSPGLPLGALCGGLIVWLALGCLLGRPLRPLPKGLAGRRIPPKVLRTGMRLALPPLRKLEKLARPRLTVLTLPLAAWLTIIGQGVIMALPIPFGNVLPGMAIIVLTVALIRRDGVGAALGHALALVSLAVLAGLGWGLGKAT